MPKDLAIAKIKEALERVENDQEFYQELLQSFFKELPDWFKLIDLANAQKSAHDLNFQAHKLKSALSNLGAAQAAELAFKLERSAKNQDFSGTLEMIAELKVEIQNFKQLVNN